MKYRLVLLCFFFAGSLAACGDPKAANKGNFTKAINEIIKVENPLCYIVSTQSFPLVLRKDGQYSSGASLAQMNALLAAGVLTAKNTQVDKNYEGLDARTELKTEGVEFSLTPLGQKAFKEKLPANEKWPQGGSGFCFGMAEVSTIVDFSEPELKQGGAVSLVKYIYKVKSAEPWTTTADVKQTFPIFAKADGEGLPGEIQLEKGVKGWRKSRF